VAEVIEKYPVLGQAFKKQPVGETWFWEQMPNLEGAVGGRKSGPAFGLVRWKLFCVLIFSFFFIKEKGHKEKNNRGTKDTPSRVNLSN
jgi:hypothetical protein